MEITIRPIDEGELAVVSALLGAADLPTAGLDDGATRVWVAVRGEEIVGSAAIELHDGDGVLRSVCVAPDGRGEGLGVALVTRCLGEARDLGLRRLFLLTETAADWFPRFGFAVTDRAGVPAAVAGSIEFASLCPASATAMELYLEPAIPASPGGTHP